MNWVMIVKILCAVFATFNFFYHLKKDNEYQFAYFLLIVLIATRNFF